MLGSRDTPSGVSVLLVSDTYYVDLFGGRGPLQGPQHPVMKLALSSGGVTCFRMPNMALRSPRVKRVTYRKHLFIPLPLEPFILRRRGHRLTYDSLFRDSLQIALPVRPTMPVRSKDNIPSGSAEPSGRL